MKTIQQILQEGKAVSKEVTEFGAKERHFKGGSLLQRQDLVRSWLKGNGWSDVKNDMATHPDHEPAMVTHHKDKSVITFGNK